MQNCNHVTKVIRYNYFALGPYSSRYRLSIGAYVTPHVLPDDFRLENFDFTIARSCVLFKFLGLSSRVISNLPYVLHNFDRRSPSLVTPSIVQT